MLKQYSKNQNFAFPKSIPVLNIQRMKKHNFFQENQCTLNQVLENHMLKQSNILKGLSQNLI